MVVTNKVAIEIKTPAAELTIEELILALFGSI
jgi:hypothetical protein